MKDMLYVWSMFLLFWSLNEILFKIISQTCFNVLKKKALFGLGCAWHAQLAADIMQSLHSSSILDENYVGMRESLGGFMFVCFLP